MMLLLDQQRRSHRGSRLYFFVSTVMTFPATVQHLYSVCATPAGVNLYTIVMDIASVLKTLPSTDYSRESVAANVKCTQVDSGNVN